MTYRIHPGFPSGFPQRITDGAVEWSNVSGSNLTLAGAGPNGSVNDFRFGTVDGAPYGRVATTDVTWLRRTFRLTQANITFDDTEDWYTGTGDSQHDPLPCDNELSDCDLDAWSTATHEIGHVAGFGHYYKHDAHLCPSNDDLHTMCRKIASGWEYMRDLQTYDEEAAHDNY